MSVNSCRGQIFVSTFILYLSSVQYVICVSKERENRHLFPLLGYLHGYKIGQNFAYQLPPFVLSPVVILPSVNQQQSVNVQDSNAEENYQENGGTFQIISPSRLILPNITEVKCKENAIDKNSLEHSFNNNVVLKPNSPAKMNLTTSDHDDDNFRQIVTNYTETTTVKSTDVDNEDTTTIVDFTVSKMESSQAVSLLPGPYPTAVYNNTNINNLSITTEPLSLAPIRYNLTVLNVDSNQNFTDKNTNNSSNIDNQSTGIDKLNMNSPVDVSSTFRGYSYPNSWYNPVADKLSIPTNSYTNYESPLPPIYDDRWQSFASPSKSYPTSAFRPLAGLYHDGFLHKYLIKKTGFVPVNSKYLYYN